MKTGQTVDGLTEAELMAALHTLQPVPHRLGLHQLLQQRQKAEGCSLLHWALPWRQSPGCYAQLQWTASADPLVSCDLFEGQLLASTWQLLLVAGWRHWWRGVSCLQLQL